MDDYGTHLRAHRDLLATVPMSKLRPPRPWWRRALELFGFAKPPMSDAEIGEAIRRHLQDHVGAQAANNWTSGGYTVLVEHDD